MKYMHVGKILSDLYEEVKTELPKPSQEKILWSTYFYPYWAVKQIFYKEHEVKVTK
jgi:hypothetical protein